MLTFEQIEQEDADRNPYIHGSVQNAWSSGFRDGISLGVDRMKELWRDKTEYVAVIIANEKLDKAYADYRKLNERAIELETQNVKLVEALEEIAQWKSQLPPLAEEQIARDALKEYRGEK